jgi:hypothetical protein
VDLRGIRCTPGNYFQQHFPRHKTTDILKIKRRNCRFSIAAFDCFRRSGNLNYTPVGFDFWFWFLPASSLPPWPVENAGGLRHAEASGTQ